MKKVLYFTTGPIPTPQEQADPAPDTLPDTQAVVTDGETLTVGGSDYTFTVVDGEITDIVVT